MRKLFLLTFLSVFLVTVISCEDPNRLNESEDDGEIVWTIDTLLFLHVSNKNYELGTTYSEIEFIFPDPGVMGADGYYLEYAGHMDDPDDSWDVYQDGGGDLFITDFFGGDIEIRPVYDMHYFYRLRVVGGPLDGQRSNRVRAETSSTTLNIPFAGRALDESVSVTGVIAPRSGFGIIAEFFVNPLSDPLPDSVDLNYQWYRQDPTDYETIPTAITGANGSLQILSADYDESVVLRYETVEEDEGYQIILEVIEVSDGVGSLIRFPSTWIVQ